MLAHAPTYLSWVRATPRAPAPCPLDTSHPLVCTQRTYPNPGTPKHHASTQILDQIPKDTKKRCLVFIVLDRWAPTVHTVADLRMNLITAQEAASGP